jgi:hypothetical protein
LRTTDGGITWNQSIQLQNWLYGVRFTDSNTGIAIGDHGTILRTTTGGTTWIEDEPSSIVQIPKQFTLSQNYPNPFNPSTTISFTLPSKSFISLKIYDLLGREVATLASEVLSAGRYTRQWNAMNMPSGVYFYRLQVYPDAVGTGSYSETKKLVLIR